MIRTILSLFVIATLATAISVNAEPTPSADRTSSKNTKKVEAEKSPTKTDATSKTNPVVRSAEGWTYVKGEWIHSDGYKFVNGQVVRTGARTQRSPPKPPSNALLNSVKSKPTPSPDPNSAAAKAAQREKNLTPRPASQTGSHL